MSENRLGKQPSEKAHQQLTLDVVVPTYNRRAMLGCTIASLRNAVAPAGLDVRIIVVDNNSTDGTREFVASQIDSFDGRLKYVREIKQGRSFALNAGIASGLGELVGFIDDDEEIDPTWYARVYSAFAEGGIDFVGGPYKPRWSAPPPDWYPPDYPAVIGWIDGGSEVAAYGSDYPGILMGGNAVLTREILRRVGLFKTWLSRAGTRLLAGEDEDMYKRLLDAGARGLYLPDLIIYHHVPPERLTKAYFRRWCFWRGVSRGLIDRESRSGVAYLGGVPRWLYGKAAHGLIRKARASIGRRVNRAEGFSGELAVWDLAGFFYGKHFYRPVR
jgi:glycosyltransferase involved in cell wall biosynthesis